MLSYNNVSSISYYRTHVIVIRIDVRILRISPIRTDFVTPMLGFKQKNKKIRTNQ
jgi:hypothetical protein